MVVYASNHTPRRQWRMLSLKSAEAVYPPTPMKTKVRRQKPVK